MSTAKTKKRHSRWNGTMGTVISQKRAHQMEFNNGYNEDKEKGKREGIKQWVQQRQRKGQKRRNGAMGTATEKGKTEGMVQWVQQRQNKGQNKRNGTMGTAMTKKRAKEKEWYNGYNNREGQNRRMVQWVQENRKAKQKEWYNGYSKDTENGKAEGLNGAMGTAEPCLRIEQMGWHYCTNKEIGIRLLLHTLPFA